MNPADAKALAVTLMAEHELDAWRFTFDNAKRRFGRCNYTKKQIQLSRPLVVLNDEPQVRDTILHEIAHALTPGAGHGPKWKAACRKIGANPNRCYDDDEVASPDGRWVATCPVCEHTYTRHRRPKGGGSCPCRKTGKFDETTRLVWHDRHDLAVSGVAAHASGAGATSATTATPPEAETTNVEEPPEPTPTTTTTLAGHAVLNDVRGFLTTYMAFTEPEQADAVTLWVAHTFAMDAAETTPRLSIQSAEKQSGKTRLLELIDLLAAQAMSVASISASAMFRLIAEDRVTLLVDEADAIFSGRGGRAEDLRGILNAGYRRGGTVARVNGAEVIQYPVFAPVALAGIGALPDTVQDRSIIIKLKRRRNDDVVQKLRRRDVEAEAFGIKAAVGEWVRAHVPDFVDHRPELPPVLSDRAADIWEPLFEIAAVAGGDWLARATAAAIVLSAAGEGGREQSQGVRLLADVRRVWDESKRAKMPSADLAKAVCALDDGKWDVDSRELAKLLAPYDVRPKTMRFSDKSGGVVRGYDRKDFQDAFARYLAPPKEGK